jgi:hypothetical protein
MCCDASLDPGPCNNPRVPRRGIALVLALLAMIVISALLAALFFAVNEETRAGSALSDGNAALAVGESSIEAGLEHLRLLPSESLPIGGVETRSVEGERFPSLVYITRLDSTLFWLVAAVRSDRDPRVTLRRVGVLASRAPGSPDSIRTVRVTERGWSELY